MSGTYFGISQLDAFVCQQLQGHSARIAHLLGLEEPHSRLPFLSCLDDLLGAVYSLFYAVHHEYIERPDQLAADDINAVQERARDMAEDRVRMEGKWTAGYYFNSALFRIASVYHRALKIVTGHRTERFQVLLRQVREWFKSSHEAEWTCGALEKIDDEVNVLKHTPEGIFTGRTVAFAQAVQAVDELLTLLEAFQREGPARGSDPIEEERIAAIEHVVYEYANLMSAAYHSVKGPAPVRTHSDDAFLLGCRKIGDFLLADERRNGDDVLALDYLPGRSARTWNLPIWRREWRSAMNKQLTHITYERVRRSKPWDHRKWILPLEAEFRTAWNEFLAAASARFKAEYERQIDACRIKEGFEGLSL